MYRTLRQQDSIKIVILDLDDTLWRGVIAEEGTDNPALIEGWPLGITEALSVLKRRGILLSIVSKNDESTIRKLWDRAIGNRLPLTAFAAVKINWEPKARNVEAILKETNLLARNALFIDDNPTERDGVQSVYPEIRTLGADLYYIRRILLWAPELQVASITDEATRRTEMVQAQVAREQAREMMPRGEFLASLKVEVSRITIDSTEHPRFARALELINKTNQFNTTGERRTLEGLQLLFSKQAKLEAFEVYDRFTDYGLVAVVVINGQTIEQFVMSCRVVGLDVELAIMATLAGELCQSGTARGLTRDTDANFLSRKVFENSGFSNADNVWTATREKLISLPSHITFRA
jgi:FkbH-like protein